MRRRVPATLALAGMSLAFCIDSVYGSENRPVTLVRGGKTDYSIVLTGEASAVDRSAANELQKYLKKISGADFPIGEGTSNKSSHQIWIASAGKVRGFPLRVDWGSLKEDGFTIQTDGTRIYIAGGTGKGTLNAVYTFLEEYLGCRKYSPSVEVIPSRKDVILPPVQITQIPKVTFRDAFFYDSAYMDWHKLDNHDDLFGLYVHTFRHFLPPEKYFKSHPEYYTLAPAGRIPDNQLCLTNPDVFSIIVDGLRNEIAAQPDKTLWSVSQNDTYGPCGCKPCRRIDSIAGSNAGSLLTFVNRIAEQFPGKTISTLAYQYSRSAPKTVKPGKNVNIMLCSIECNRSKPIATDPGSASFRTDIENWTGITDNIYLWDYVVQFRNLMSPFPNFRVLQPNIQFFVKHGITSIFEQGAGRLPNEFKELRLYLIAKLLWDPDINVDSVMNDFLSGYYGKAGAPIREYIDTMHDALEASGEDLLIYGFPLPSERGYLSARNMDRYVSLFDSAEASVRNEPDVLRRVQIARLPLQFALLEQAKLYGRGQRGFFERKEGGTWGVRDQMKTLLETFTGRCREFGITALDESGTTPETFAEWTQRFLESSMRPHLALFKKVELKVPASMKYHQGQASALTDGLAGLEDFRMNWLGFEGEEMEATVDLGDVRTVRKLQTNFLQDNNSWVFLPQEVEYSLSSDGKEYDVVGTVPAGIPPERTGIFCTPFGAVLSPREARFVRVRTTSFKICPNWHKGAGGPAWIFADEIVVE